MDIAQMRSPFVGGSWMGGMILHFINGAVIFPLIYALLLYPMLPGGPTIRGSSWGLTLWVLAQAVVMPVMGGGFFSSNMGGMMAAVASLVGHVVTVRRWAPSRTVLKSKRTGIRRPWLTGRRLAR